MMLSRFLDDAYMTILFSPLNCCLSTPEQSSRRGIEQSMRIELHQPRLLPSPLFEPQERTVTRGQEWADSTRSFASSTSSRGSFSVRRKLNSYNGSRRPHIRKPTEFRHVDRAIMPKRVVSSFRPLELNIYTDNQLSPILPHFDDVDEMSYTRDSSLDLTYPVTALTQRSESAMSFRIPRKPVRSNSRTSSEWNAQFKPRPHSLSANELLLTLEQQLPKAPPAARIRSHTAPLPCERVQSALHERYELEQKLKDIEEIIEVRKSFHNSSRPVSQASQSRTTDTKANEPMLSSATAVVPLAPVSAEPKASMVPPLTNRAVLPLADQRPRTTLSKTVYIPSRLKSFTEASAAFSTPSPSSTSSIHQVSRFNRSDRSLPPPPLPLILQAGPPQIRKKKSFSSVSKWLFPSATDHYGNVSLDAVTNTPKAVTSREGFYQCVDFQPSPRHSTDSILSTISTIQSTLEEPAINSTWTLGSSSTSDMDKRDVMVRTFSVDEERDEKSIELSRIRTFGEKELECVEPWRMEPLPIPGRNNVGVAF